MHTHGVVPQRMCKTLWSRLCGRSDQMALRTLPAWEDE